MENLNPKKKANNESPIADVHDTLLIEIFIRLACYKTVITCKFVSKRWLSLLSNPKFVIEFVEHKRKNGQRILPWTFLSLTGLKLINDLDDDDDDNEKTGRNQSFNIDIHNKVFYSSPMNFLPRGSSSSFKIVASFKDLILYIDDISRKHYYICNPVTKRWVDVPPTPSPSSSRCWSCLICRDPFTNNNDNIDDYEFRIVVVRFPINFKAGLNVNPFITLKVIVFCSENSQWIDIDVRFPLYPNQSEPVRFLKGVVCNGMVCLCYNKYFGMFNPFDVTPMTIRGTTLEARRLPIPLIFARSKLLECGGRLIAVRPSALSPTYHEDKEGNLLVDYRAGISVRIYYQELDLNQVVNNNVEVGWMGFKVCICIDKTGRSRSVLSGIRMINVHPTNKRLLYILTASYVLLLCDTRSSTLKTLGRLEQLPDQDHSQSSKFTQYEEFKHLQSSSNHLQVKLQHWPTPLPTIRPS